MNDFCDGEVFTYHPLFSVHEDALQIFLYFDELEICNPLGSKAKIHKLGGYLPVLMSIFVYFTSYRYILLHTWQHIH